VSQSLNGIETSAAAARMAVLVSGLDSGVLVAELLAAGHAVFPIYVRCGLRWESDELTGVQRFLTVIAHPRLAALTILQQPVAELYAGHWSMADSESELEIPDAETPDEAVYLPGRNVLLLAKTLVWCRMHEIGAVAMATLEANPFADATPDFLNDFAAAVAQAIGGMVQVVQPYANLEKADVIRRGRDLPLHLLGSCLSPKAGRQCGACNKCAERQGAFQAAGVIDRTAYASQRAADFCWLTQRS
jgi:7-cyano-7-deazaguanine synthase